MQLRVVRSANLAGQTYRPKHVGGTREYLLQEAGVSVNSSIEADNVQCLWTSPWFWQC